MLKYAPTILLQIMPYRTPAKREKTQYPPSLKEVLAELPVVERSEAILRLEVVDKIKDACSALFAEAFERYFPGANIIIAITRTASGSMAYSKADSYRSMTIDRLYERHAQNQLSHQVSQSEEKK